MKTVFCVLLIALASAVPSAMSATSAASSPQTLTGVVIRKEWTKSEESWNAGGSEYYVLKVEGDTLAPSQRSAREGVILRPSRRVSFARSAEFVGKRVQCRGRFVADVAHVPAKHSVEQSPQTIPNPITGKVDPPTRGAGFRVDAISLAK
jgi:hypothetical protein